MSNQPGAAPPGFYPAEGGRRRYWDGQAWTDRYEDTEATAGPSAAPGGKRSGGLRRWLLPAIAALVALFIGAGIGAAGKSGGTTGAASTSTVTATAAVSTVTATASTVTATATVSNAGATVTAPPVTVAPPPVTVTAPPVTAPPVTVALPPVTVTYTPPPPAPGTSMDAGVYVVGQDIQPGTYRVREAISDSCYWQISKSGTNGADILKNDLPAGGFPQVVLATGQDFSSKRCGTWVKK